MIITNSSNVSRETITPVGAVAFFAEEAGNTGRHIFSLEYARIPSGMINFLLKKGLPKLITFILVILLVANLALNNSLNVLADDYSYNYSFSSTFRHNAQGPDSSYSIGTTYHFDDTLTWYIARTNTILVPGHVYLMPVNFSVELLDYGWYVPNSGTSGRPPASETDMICNMRRTYMEEDLQFTSQEIYNPDNNQLLFSASQRGLTIESYSFVRFVCPNPAPTSLQFTVGVKSSLFAPSYGSSSAIWRVNAFVSSLQDITTGTTVTLGDLRNSIDNASSTAHADSQANTQAINNASSTAHADSQANTQAINNASSTAHADSQANTQAINNSAQQAQNRWDSEVNQSNQGVSDVTSTISQAQNLENKWEILWYPITLTKRFSEILSGGTASVYNDNGIPVSGYTYNADTGLLEPVYARTRDSTSDTVITFPAYTLPVLDVQIWDEYSYDLADLRSQFPALFSASDIIITVVELLMFLEFLYNKYLAVFGGDD